MSKYKSFHEAMIHGTVDDVKYFVEEKGVDVNDVNAYDTNRYTMLHWAAYGSTRVEVFEYLISKGANVNAKDRFGKTLLHVAADHNPCIEVLDYLIAKGISIDVKDDSDMTPLHHAILNNPNVEVIKHLVSKGANINARNVNGFTPKDFAKKNGKEHLLPSSGCYIATCVYGSYDCPEVWTLRRYRDNKLSNSWFGRRFIQIYYAVSPKIVELFGNKKWFTKFWRTNINNIVRKLQHSGIDSNLYSDL